MRIPFMLRFMLVVFLAVGINSCCKDPKPGGGGTTQSKDPVFKEYWLGESKDYMYFKKGTWWVYKNMQNGKTDSVYVTSSTLDTFSVKGQYDHSRHRTYIYESCRIQTKSQRYNQTYQWFSGSYNPDATDTSETGVTVWERQKSPGGGGYICLRTPFIISNGDHLSSSFYHITKDTSMTIQGKSYSNVQKIQINMDHSYPYLLDENSSNQNFYMHVYHAKGYGIIKYEEPMESKSIELIKSKIIQ